MESRKPIFKVAKKRTSKNWKNWKLWLAFPQNSHLAGIKDFKRFKRVINAEFQLHWLDDVFRFAKDTMDFENCTPAGLTWLRCEYAPSFIHLAHR
jgi:hypothetical protein